MATVTQVKAKEREKALALAAKEGARTLAGGLSIPVGTHKFLVADKDAFGILNVESKTSGKWALPIVAGVITLEKSGDEIEVELSDKPGAKTLVIPDAFFLAMQTGAEYDITIEARNGRNVVVGVAAAVEAE